MTKSAEILQKYWGYGQFRPLQEDIVDSAIYGHDTLAILPTGGGKSICYQVPGLALEGICIVVSPLIALMEDQVRNLKKRGIRAELITSALSYREIDIALDNARFGNTKFLYTSPERLQSPLFVERCKQMNVALIAVDEAHCISEWGHEFRPAYRQIADLRALHPDAPVIALTASATLRVQEDIVKQLALRSPQKFSASLQRENLRYQARVSTNKTEDVLLFCKRHPGQCGIVYCRTRKSVKQIARQLRAERIPAGFYHGGLSPEDRKFMSENWMNGKLEIMVATNAFGMGIDKPDVRYVLHFEVPNNLEAYYQEAGRAGRDGKEALAVAFWEQKDLDLMQQIIEAQYPDKERVKEIFQAVCNALTIAYGSGEQETYSFDIAHFQKHFGFAASELFYALKILQLNGTLEFNEQAFQPTRLRFAVGQSALYKFQVAHDSLAPLIALLSRTTPGIFEQFCRIQESELARMLKISPQEFRKQLETLERYGVIDVNYQSDLPKITLLVPRPAEGQLQIGQEIYERRKSVELQKLAAVREYLQAEHCRQQMICAYFETDSAACGKCDVCMSRQRSAHSFEELLKIIPTRLPATLAALQDATHSDKELLQRALHQLMLEEVLLFVEGEYRLA
jgi:ATP-dependent DNA helicase RecQ